MKPIQKVLNLNLMMLSQSKYQTSGTNVKYLQIQKQLSLMNTFLFLVMILMIDTDNQNTATHLEHKMVHSKLGHTKTLYGYHQKLSQKNLIKLIPLKMILASHGKNLKLLRMHFALLMKTEKVYET